MAKIKIDSSLFDRIREIAQSAGYSSVDEFIVHLLEKELEKIESPENDRVVEGRLRGLGYIE